MSGTQRVGRARPPLSAHHRHVVHSRRRARVSASVEMAAHVQRAHIAELVEQRADPSTRGPDGRLAAYACALEAGNAQTAAWLQEKVLELKTSARLHLLKP